jgi:hypothetical protein
MSLLRLWLVFIASALSVIFLLYRPDGQIGFMYSGIVLNADTYFYNVYEHLGMILIAITLMFFERKYTWFFQLFLFIQLLDFFFYLLFYKSPWIAGVPWNALKNIFLGVPLAFVTIKTIVKHGGTN